MAAFWKKCPKNGNFTAYALLICQFSAFLNISKNCLTLRGCGSQTTGPTVISGKIRYISLIRHPLKLESSWTGQKLDPFPVLTYSTAEPWSPRKTSDGYNFDQSPLTFHVQHKRDINWKYMLPLSSFLPPTPTTEFVSEVSDGAPSVSGRKKGSTISWKARFKSGKCKIFKPLACPCNVLYVPSSDFMVVWQCWQKE